MVLEFVYEAANDFASDAVELLKFSLVKALNTTDPHQNVDYGRIKINMVN